MFGFIHMVNNSVCFSGKKEVCTAPEPVLADSPDTSIIQSVDFAQQNLKIPRELWRVAA